MMFTHFKKIYGVGLKNQITIILFQIGPTSHSFSEANPGGGGGAHGYFWGGYVPPGTQNWPPVQKQNFP